MKVPVSGTGFPQEVEVEADVVLGDPSQRIKPGIALTVTWTRRDGSEWGTKQFITIEE